MTIDDVIGYFERRMEIPLDDKIKGCEMVALRTLKKQRGIEPEIRNTLNGASKYACGFCGYSIGNVVYAANYCYSCGQKINWVGVP